MMKFSQNKGAVNSPIPIKKHNPLRRITNRRKSEPSLESKKSIDQSSSYDSPRTSSIWENSGNFISRYTINRKPQDIPERSDSQSYNQAVTKHKKLCRVSEKAMEHVPLNGNGASENTFPQSCQSKSKVAQLSRSAQIKLNLIPVSP